MPTYPYGTLIRVVSQGTPTPPPDALIRINEAIYQHYRLRPSRVPLPPWQADAQREYARAWLTLAAAADAARRPDVAAPLRARAAAYIPPED